MITMLTSSTGFYKKDKDGKRTPDKFYWYNGFLDRLSVIGCVVGLLLNKVITLGEITPEWWI